MASFTFGRVRDIRRKCGLTRLPQKEWLSIVHSHKGGCMRDTGESALMGQKGEYKRKCSDKTGEGGGGALELRFSVSRKPVGRVL